jgi:hypothetical protein
MISNHPGMGGELPEFNSISRLPPDVARETMYRTSSYIMVAYLNIELLVCTIGIVSKMGTDILYPE